MPSETELPLPQVINIPEQALQDDSKIHFGNSKTLRTSAHRQMVMNFVRDQYPQATFQMIYDARANGWTASDFHAFCDTQGWTLTLVQTVEDHIFGGFTTADWESSDISKHDPASFLFSVNEGCKYPITGGGRQAIGCSSQQCAQFGAWRLSDMVIWSESNSNTKSWCYAKRASFQLPAARGEECEMDSSSINGGKRNFKSK